MPRQSDRRRLSPQREPQQEGSPVNRPKLRVAQIGLGYWGPNLLRNLATLPDVDVVAVADLDPSRLAVARLFGADVKTTRDPLALLVRDDLVAVVIATPPRTHFDLTRRALEAGKHVLVEKPLATSIAEGSRLVALAEARGLVLMVGHTFLYSPATHRLKQYLDEGELGNVLYLYSQRLNLGRIREDVNALWNFGPHDVSLILYLLGRRPTSVCARGFACLRSGVEDVVFLTLEFSGQVGAHVHVSWIDPHKVRRLTVVGTRRMAVYDDVSADAKLTVYDRGVDRIPTQQSPGDFRDFAEFQHLIRRGDVSIPALPFAEPLQAECQHFIECIQQGSRPLTDGRHGLDVVRVLEAAQHSLKEGGAFQEVV